MQSSNLSKPLQRVLLAVVVGALSACSNGRDAKQEAVDATLVPIISSVIVDTVVAANSSPFGIVPLSDTLLAVIDSYDPIVSFIDTRTGKLLLRFGKRGSGPGEFRSIEMVQQLSDSTVLATDPNQQRALEINLLRGTSRTIRLHHNSESMSAFQQTVAYRREGAWVSYQPRRFTSTEGKVFAITDTPAIFVTDSINSRRIISLPPRRSVVIATENSINIVGLGQLAPTTVAACDSGFVAVDTSGLRRYDVTGVLRSSRPHRIGWTAVTDQLRESSVAGSLPDKLDPANRSAAERLLKQQAQESTQYFGGFLIDPRGGVWVRTNSASIKREVNQVVRLDDDGNASLTINVPMGSGVAAMGSGYLVGWQHDRDTEAFSFIIHSFKRDESTSTAWQCTKQTVF